MENSCFAGSEEGVAGKKRTNSRDQVIFDQISGISLFEKINENAIFGSQNPVFGHLDFRPDFRECLKQRFFWKKTRFDAFFEKQRFLAIFSENHENFFHEKQVFCVLVPYRQRILQKSAEQTRKISHF